eukprot:2901883-Heterocapsa_arctica.AAC.1
MAWRLRGLGTTSSMRGALAGARHLESPRPCTWMLGRWGRAGSKCLGPPGACIECRGRPRT